MGSCTSNQNVKDSTKHPRKDEAKQENQPGHTALPLPSQPAKPSVSSEDLSNFPDFFYLDRAKGSLYQITKSQSTEFPLKSRFNLPQDSALTALPNGLLMSVGGLVKQSLVKLVYTIDLQSKVVSELPDLPFPCKLGQLHPIGDFVYFIGGVKNGKTDLQQAPLMRYNFRLSFWEDLWKYGEQFQFDRIVNMGTCAFGSKICLIGGQKINSSGLLRNNKKIYSVDVEDGFKVQLEEKIPFKVIRPVIANGRKNAVVTGGVDPKTGKSNRGSFLLISQNSGLKIVKINDVGFDLKESYPAIYEQDTVIFISRPFIAVRIKKINNWIAFEITGKDTRRALAVVNEKRPEDGSSDESFAIENASKVDFRGERQISNEEHVRYSSVYSESPRKSLGSKRNTERKDEGNEKQNIDFPNISEIKKFDSENSESDDTDKLREYAEIPKFVPVQLHDSNLIHEGLDIINFKGIENQMDEGRNGLKELKNSFGSSSSSSSENSSKSSNSSSSKSSNSSSSKRSNSSHSKKYVSFGVKEKVSTGFKLEENEKDHDVFANLSIPPVTPTNPELLPKIPLPPSKDIPEINIMPPTLKPEPLIETNPTIHAKISLEPSKSVPKMNFMAKDLSSKSVSKSSNSSKSSKSSKSSSSSSKSSNSISAKPSSHSTSTNPSKLPQVPRLNLPPSMPVSKKDLPSKNINAKTITISSSGSDSPSSSSSEQADDFDIFTLPASDPKPAPLILLEEKVNSRQFCEIALEPSEIETEIKIDLPSEFLPKPLEATLEKEKTPSFTDPLKKSSKSEIFSKLESKPFSDFQSIDVSKVTSGKSVTFKDPPPPQYPSFSPAKKKKLLGSLSVKKLKPLPESRLINLIKSPSEDNFYFKSLPSPNLYKSQDFGEIYSKTISSRTNLIRKVDRCPPGQKKDRVKFKSQFYFSEENVQKLLDIIAAEFQVNRIFSGFVKTAENFKKMIFQLVEKKNLTIQNLFRVFAGIPLIFGKKDFNDKQISLIINSSGIKSSQSSIPADDFVLGVYKAYKMGLLKKS